MAEKKSKYYLLDEANALKEAIDSLKEKQQEELKALKAEYNALTPEDKTSKKEEFDARKYQIVETYTKDIDEKMNKLITLKQNPEYIAQKKSLPGGRRHVYDNLEDPSETKKGDVLISVQNLEVKFSVRNKILTAIRNISLDIYKGETIAVVGESGSGKSVFTKTLTGMLESNGAVSNGKILYSGVDLAQFEENEEWLAIRGKRIATIFQDPMTSLNPLRRIGSQITEVIRLHRGFNKEDAKAEAIRLLKRVGITDAEKRFNDYPFQYSGGMRQRVVIAIALACAPDILICDEPTTALDVTIQAQILNLIQELKQEYGFTVIFITHDLGVVAEVADRVAVMYAGQIVEYGTVNDIYYDPRHPYTWSLLSSLPQLGEKGESLYAITGTPPSLFNKIKGDAFAPRNPYALAIDFVKEPPMFKVSDTHYAKTWLLDPRAPKTERPAIIGEISARVAKIYKGGKDDE